MRKTIKKFISTATAAIIMASSLSAVVSANSADMADRGYIDGFNYHIWNQDDKGDVSMTPKAGSFTCSWNDVDSFMARMGKIYDKPKNYKSMDKITLSYNVEYSAKGNSYLCVYGWTTDPLVEYYIVEGWTEWRPPGWPEINNGTVTLNGNVYDVYKTMRYNQPSPMGTQTFPQYWSVRQISGLKSDTTKSMKGTVDVSSHFKRWSDAGMDMSGKLYDVSLCIEGFKSSGSANVKGISFNGYIPPEPTSEYTTEPTTVPEPVAPDEDGYYFKDEFENGIGKWGPRGGTVGLTGADGFSGTDGIVVLDRSDYWNGAERFLEPNAFFPGSTYSFGAVVMQKSEASTPIRLCLQYIDMYGEYCYDKIAECTAPKGEWADLSNTSFTIPKGASDLTLYIEAPDSLTDFYIDSAFGGVKDAPPISDAGNHTIGIPGSEITTASDEPRKHIVGDINDDGVIDSFDLAPLRRGILKMMSGIGSALVNADVNGDGSVNVADLVLLQRFILGMEKSFPDPVTTTTAKPVTTTAQTTVTTTAASY